jgi:hypothetical protein
MSHTNVIYPQSIDRNPAAWQVREDDDNYSKRAPVSYPLIGLQDRLSDRLERARAMTHLLQSADILLEYVVRDTARVLEEHIEQAQEANAQMWERIRQEKRDQQGS